MTYPLLRYKQCRVRREFCAKQAAKDVLVFWLWCYLALISSKNAECGGNFVPSKQPQAVLAFWLWCYLALISSKNAESRMNARNTRKPPPQFTNVNEEVVCRSMTQQSPAILHF